MSSPPTPVVLAEFTCNLSQGSKPGPTRPDERKDSRHGHPAAPVAPLHLDRSAASAVDVRRVPPSRRPGTLRGTAGAPGGRRDPGTGADEPSARDLAGARPGGPSGGLRGRLV